MLNASSSQFQPQSAPPTNRQTAPLSADSRSLNKAHDPCQNLPSRSAPNSSHSTDNHCSLNQRNNHQDIQGTTVSVRHHSYKVHGAKAALEIRPCEKIKKDDEHVLDQNGMPNTFHSITLESARSLNNGSRKFDWDKKVYIQLTKEEFPLFIGVCLGMFPKINFQNHGIGAEKGKKFFEVEFQGSNLFIKMGNHLSGVHTALPVSLPDAIYIGQMCLSQYMKNFPGLDSQTCLQQIQFMCNMYTANGVLEIVNKIPTSFTK
ncbi:hypothetical protein [Vibrio owensii]|uniref:hypothetical protein n=1 Tax=Vibrio owensii TaxID=696485 RepID=UPI0040678BD8